MSNQTILRQTLRTDAVLALRRELNDGATRWLLKYSAQPSSAVSAAYPFDSNNVGDTDACVPKTGYEPGTICPYCTDQCDASSRTGYSDRLVRTLSTGSAFEDSRRQGLPRTNDARDCMKALSNAQTDRVHRRPRDARTEVLTMEELIYVLKGTMTDMNTDDPSDTRECTNLSTRVPDIAMKMTCPCRPCRA